jgi:hypothetical protein
MSATIERYTINGAFGSSSIAEPTDFVLHADHLASHAYDEVKERALFEAGINPHSRRRNEVGDYVLPSIQDSFSGWLACAKSRAKAAGCE